MKKRALNTAYSFLLVLATAFVSPQAVAAPIIWGGVTTVAGDTDVLTTGTLNYAYAMSGASPTVNGVAFTGSNSQTALGTNVTLTGWTGAGFGNHTAFNSTSAPYSGLSAAYKDQIRGGDYTAGATAASLQLNNLTVGHNYATQIWVNDSRGCCAGRTETLTGGGGNTVTLDYGNTNVEGAVGSYSVGLFNANATTQSFTLQGNASTQFNSVQVRDVTNIGYWTGTGGATWDAATTANFASNLFSAALTTTDFASAKAPLKAVTFADAYWNSGATTAVTQNTVTIAAGGVSTGSVLFQNTSSLSYTVNSADATGITGATTLAVTSNGSVTLTGMHTYTGVTTIATGGTLSITSAGGLGGGAYAGAIVNNGTFAFNSSANQTFSGVIAGTGSLTKNGSAVLTLSGANTYSGPTTISAGRVVAGNASAFGAAGNTITVAAGASLDINAQTLQGYTNNISISGTGTIASLGALGNTNAAQNVNAIRGITLTGDASIGGDGGRWDIGRVDFNVNPAITVDHITGGGFTLTKVGTSYLGLLTGATNLNGFIINGGTVAPHENTAFGTGPVTLNPGTILQPWGGLTQANTFNLAGGTIQTDSFNETFTGPINVTGAVTINPLNISGAGNIIFNGNVTGNGSINKIGPFSFILSGNNSGFTGSLTNSVSNTFLNSATAGSASASFVVNAGILANTTAGVVTQDLGSLAGTGGQLGNNVAGGAVTFSIGANDASTSFAGAIVDSVGGGGTTAITKVGIGTLTLTNTSTYSGGTTISAGKLLVNNTTGSGTGTGTVTVQSGGTLGGSGTVGDVNVLAGGIVAPGNSPGILSSGSVTTSGGTYQFEIGGLAPGNSITDHDQLSVTGSLGLGSSVAVATFTNFGGYIPTGSEMFVLIKNDGVDAIIGQFSSLSEGTLVSVAGIPFYATYTADAENNLRTGGNDFALIPEPTHWALLFGAGGLMLLRRSR